MAGSVKYDPILGKLREGDVEIATEQDIDQLFQNTNQ